MNKRYVALSSLNHTWLGGRNYDPKALQFGGGTVRTQKIGEAKGWVGGKNCQKMEFLLKNAIFNHFLLKMLKSFFIHFLVDRPPRGGGGGQKFPLEGLL